MKNQESSSNPAADIVVDMLAEKLKPAMKQAMHEAVEELSENVKPRPPGPLTVQEAADYLSIPKSTLYQFTSKKQIPFHKRGKKLYFYQDDLDKWVKGAGEKK